MQFLVNLTELKVKYKLLLHNVCTLSINIKFGAMDKWLSHESAKPVIPVRIWVAPLYCPYDVMNAYRSSKPRVEV